jgi:hypothetical protein
VAFTVAFGLDTRVQLEVTEVIAMIRVTKTEEPSKTLVTIDGQLSGEAVGLVQACCKEAESVGKPVHLFLRDVTAIDDGGRLLLQRLAGNGVRVSGSGLYTSYLVEELTAAANGGRSSPVDADDGLNKLRGKTP